MHGHKNFQIKAQREKRERDRDKDRQTDRQTNSTFSSINKHVLFV